MNSGKHKRHLSRFLESFKAFLFGSYLKFGVTRLAEKMKTPMVLILLVVMLAQMRTISAQTFAFGAPYYQICLTSLTKGSNIGQITTNTANSVFQVIYPNSNIAINPYTGALTLINDVLSGTVQVLQVQATSPTGSILTTNVNVFATSGCTSSGVTVTSATTSASAITTVSATAPQFASSFYTFIPSTCSPGSLVGSLSATAASGVTYSVSGTSAFSFTSPTSGNLYLTGTPPTSYPATFTITATSTGGTKSVTANVYLPTCLSATTSGTAVTTTIAPAATTTRVFTTLPTLAPGVPAGVDLG